MLIAIIVSVIVLVALFFIGTFIAYYLTFYSGNMKLPNMGDVVSGPKYDNYWDEINKNIELFKKVPYEEVHIESFDKKQLFGRFYPCKSSKNVMVLFHGYKSSIDVDGSKAVDICTKNGFNVLCVHQRGHGKSEGKSIAFGILERKDCRSWVEYIISRIGNDVNIMLMGISMGAATVMLSSNLNIPQIKGIFADCGYSSTKEMLKIGIKKMKLPQVVYPFLRLSAKMYGGFDPEEITPVKALFESEIPITIVHGDGDDFVPHYMGKECFDAAKSKIKRFESFAGAGHAISYYYDKEKYESLLYEMMDIVSK